MPKSRALKEEIAIGKPKSKKEILKEIYKSGKEEIVYGQETLIRGKIKMMGAKIMMRNKSILEE